MEQKEQRREKINAYAAFYHYQIVNISEADIKENSIYDAAVSLQMAIHKGNKQKIKTRTQIQQRSIPQS